MSILPLSATTTDLQLSGDYTGGTTLSINGSALNFGTLNDLDATQALTITNTSSTAGSLTLNTAANSTSGANASDLLYVATAGNLKVQSGAGTLTLSIVASGNIDNNGTLNISAPVSISLGSTATFTGTGATTVSGAIGAFLGSVAVNDAGGSVTLSGNNGYIGNTTITSGTLIVSNIVVSGGVSNLGNATSNVILGGTTTSGLLSYTGSTATYTRGFTVNAGGGEVDVTTAGQTLTIGSGAVTTSGSGVFTIGGAGNTSITSVIGGGSGGLTKTGTGTLSLSSSNNYAGTTNINGGVLQINAANELGSAVAANTIGFNGGTLESTANSYSLGTTRSIALNGAGTIQVDTGTLTVNGIISGAGTMTEAGSGVLSLVGANTGYTGAFVLSAGTLSLANTAAFNSSNAVTINAGTLDLNGTATETIGSLSGTGGTVTNSGSTSAILTLGGGGTTSYSGTITALLANGAPTVLGLTVALTGSGSQTLSGANTYTGLTTISSGKLILGSSTALGNGGLVRSVGTGGVTVSSGATLDMNGQTNINKVLTLNGTGVGSNGALIDGSATAATIGSGISSINVSGTFTGLNANTTVSIGAPTTGTTATATAVLGVTTSSFSVNGGTTSYTVAPTVTIGGGTGATAVANLSLGVVTSITVTNPGSGFTTVPTISFSGGTVLIQGTNPTGTGVDGHFTLDGVEVTSNGSGYTTTPTVSLSSGSVTTTANLTTVALGSNSSVGGTGNLTINAGISGSATGLTKVGTDTLTLGAVESYTGSTVISAGTVALGIANAIATSTSLSLSGGGVLSLGANNTTVNGDVTLTSGTITGTGTLTASSTGTSYSVINGTVSAVLGGSSDTLVKVTDGTASGGIVILSGANTYTGATAINAGTLEIDGSLASGSAVTIGGASGSATPTLTGTGTIGGAVTVSSANGGVAGTINPGDSGTGTLTVGSLTLQSGGDLSFDISGATMDLLKVTNAAAIVTGAGIQIVGTALTQGDYVLATAASGLNSASLTVVGSLPSGYKLVTSSTELDLQHLANQSLTLNSNSAASISIILNSSTLVGALLSNIVPVGSSYLNVNLADAGGTGGVVSSLTSTAGTTILGGSSSTIAGTLTATTAGLNETWGIKNTDLSALTSSVTASGTLNVYNHAQPTLTIVSGNNQSAFVGGILTDAALTLSDTTGVYPAPLDVNTLVNLTGVTGSGVIVTGGTGAYVSTALSTATAGIGQTLGVSLNAGDQQTIIGAGPLSTLSQTITYNVYNHATPALTIATGNNQSVFVNGSLSAPTLTLSDTIGTAPAPLDVSTLTNLTGTTGSAVIASGSSGTYTVTGFNTTTAGLGETLTASLKAGDEQSIAGADALNTLSQTLTYNVYNHSTPTLTLTTGNNQSGIVGSTLVNATLTLTDGGTVPAPLDVNSLSNLTGATGSAVVGSGGSGTYTSTALNTTTAGIGETLAVSLKAGDEQSISGANALSTLGQTVTYNVYNHSTPTLTIGTGNNQSVFLNGALTAPTLMLSDTTGTVPAPLDVSTLTNLLGATGSGVIGSGSSGTYTATGFNTTIAGIGKTVSLSLKSGDQQTVTGANPLTTLNQTLTYNVYNHATPTLSITSGNNQSGIVGSTLTAATLTLADAGTDPAPLDVNTLSNLSGVTGSGVIASGGTGTYTAATLNTSAVGVGQTLTVGLNAGDKQAISGANALSALSETITYNVYNHSTPTLTTGTGNDQSAFVGGTITGATLTLSDTGTTPAALDVTSLTNLIGVAGSGVIGSGSSGTYTVTDFNTGTAGIGQTVVASLTTGDQQTDSGANPLGTLSQTVTYNIYNHSTPTLTVGSGNNQSTFVNGSLAGATVVLADTTGVVPAPLDVTSLNNLNGATGSGVIASDATGTYTATGFNTTTAGVGEMLTVGLTAGDEQSIPGANSLSSLSKNLTYNVYNHATPTLSPLTGTNQSGIVGSTLANATFSLADTGTFPAPLDVNSLSNLTGSTGSGVITSGSAGTYTSTALNTAVAGLGQTLVVSLEAGDQQSITGANHLSVYSQTLTYNVYNHATPTLTIATGNNQSVFVNGAISGVTLSLADSGTLTAPLDVNTLSNLTGATGSGVIGSDSSGLYSATGFNTGTAGLGETLVVSLKTGDQQTITGSNPLGTLSQTVAYNVYNHSSPTLTIATGNNQSGIVGSTLTDATLTLADPGSLSVPLDVSTLANLSGTTGSAVVATGGAGTYTTTTLNTSTAGLGQTLAVSLKAGDEQAISGANPLSSLGQTITYNVYNHSTPTLTISTGNNQSTFVNGSITGATVALADLGILPAPLDVNSLSNLAGATGSGVIGSDASGTYTVTGFNTSTAGLGETIAVSLQAGDQQIISGANVLSTLAQTVTYNVYNHATPTLTIASGNNQSAFVNGSLASATVDLADSGTLPAPLDVNTLSDLLGTTGSGVVASSSTGIYAATGFNTSTAGIAKTLTVSLKAGDEQSISGANALSTLAQTFTYNIYNHATPTLSITGGDNQSAFVNGSVVGATVTLADSGTVPAPLDVSLLSNLIGATGSAVVASNSAGVYTVTGFNTSTAGVGQSLAVSLVAGDEQSIAGANPLTTLGQTVVYNVYNHATPTLTVAGGNNQSGIVGSTLSLATLDLTDTSGSVPAPLDVNNLNDLTGATGTSVVASDSVGTYTSTALNTSTAGIGKVLAVSLNAGDDQSISGANPLSTLNQTLTYNVYNHATPTLTLGSGNNQSIFVNGSLAGVTLTLSDTTGTLPAPLDVGALSNLNGATGSGVISSGTSGIYTATGFSTGTPGLGKTLAVSLQSGDQQTITGANALSTLGQTVTYNVYNHAMPTLTLTSGNNQSAILGSTLADATFMLADAGTVPAPLDVNMLSNLTGATGSGVIASNSSGTYTSVTLNTSAVGIAQTLNVSLNAGDEQSIAGANALSALAQTVTYNVYNHATPTLTIATGNNQSIFVNGSLASATLTLSDGGTAPAPLDVTTLGNLIGTTGSGVIGSDSSGTYTATGFNTSSAGIGKTLAVSLKTGDQQTITGANPLTTLSQSIDYNVYNHATPTLTIARGNNQSAIVGSALTNATLSLTDAGSAPAPLDVSSLTNLTGATGSGVIGSDSVGTYTSTALNTSVAGNGQTLVASLDAGDQQSITGANPLGAFSQTVVYNVYNHSTPTLTIATGNNQSVFVGGSLIGATVTLADMGTLPAPLDVNSLTNLSGATGSGVIPSNGTGTYTASGFIAATAGIGQTVVLSLDAGDQQTVAGANPLSTYSQTFTYNVYNHATPTLAIASGNNQSGFVGATLANATLTLADSGNLSVPLDVNSLSNLTGATGSAVIGSGASGTYTSTALNTSTAGIGQTLALSLKAGDEQSIAGANVLSTLGQTITYNVYNHATPTLTVGAGNNQSAFVNGVVSGANVTLTDSGNVPSPLDVASLNHLIGATGSGVVGSNSSGIYSVTGFNTSTAGLGQTLGVSLMAGDEQSITGANPLSTLNQTVTYNVYNHATPTVAITSGNNQSVFVNGTITGATLTLADAGTVPAPLDVNSLMNLTGATGSAVVGSDSTGIYTATGFNTSTPGLGQTLEVSLNAGDEQSISGANALGTLTQVLTYNVYSHATPTLTIATGNNQSAIVGTALSNATLTLADAGSSSAPLDVGMLSNLTGTTGSDVIATGGTGTYATTALNTATAGIGLTLAVSLQAGDEQTLAGANAMRTLGQTITYNVYNHSTPTLTIATGNNQSGIVGSTLANATLLLADTGTLPAPLDVNTLTNLTGATGSGVIGSGGSGTYTSAAFNTSTVGLGQTISVGLMAGDQQTIAGANPLSALSQTVTYNVYNHSAPTLSLTSGNNQTVFLNASLTAPTVTLSNAAGTLPAPLDVNSLTNLTGSTGSGIVASGASAVYMATGFSTSTPGNNQTLTVSLNAGDQQTITGANPLSTLSQTITYNVVEHAESTLTSGTITIPDEHVGYTTPEPSTNDLTTTNGTVQSDRVDLEGSAPVVDDVDLSTVSNVASGGTATIAATLMPGAPPEVIDTPVTYTFGDQTTLLGADSDDSTATITIVSEVYSGQSTWIGDGATAAAWGTLSSGFGTDWGAVQGSPGVTAAFADTDSATFGNVNGLSTQTVMLNGADPSLDSITFDASSTSYTIVAGSGGDITLDGGSSASTVTDDATGGTQTIAAPIILDGDPIINVASGDRMVFSGAISGSGDLVTIGPGTAVLTAANTYSGPTTINAGSLEVDGSLSASSVVTVGGASASGTPTLTGIGTVSGPVTLSSAAGGAFGTINPGMPNTIGTLTVGSITFQSGSLFALTMSGASTDLLNVTNAATINFGADIQITATGLTQGTYVLATAASGLNSNAFTVVGSLPTGYALVATATSLDLQHLGAAGFASTSPGTLNMIAGSTTTIGATLSNGAPSGSSVLAVNLADNGGSGGAVTGLTSSSGSTVASGASSTISGTLTAGAVGLGENWSIKNTDPNATIPVVTTGGMLNVYNHSAATFTTATGNNQSAIVGTALPNATFVLANSGTLPVPLDVGTTLTNLTGATGSGVVSSNSTGTYTSSTLNTSTAGVGQTLTVGLTAGDQQTVIGANPLGNFSQTVTYNVYNHSTPTLTIQSGNNQSAIVGSTLAIPIVSLNDTTGTLPAPLDVNTLTNLTGASGSGAVESGLSSTYTTSALNTTTAGVGQTLSVSLVAGDEQSIVGANPLNTLSQTITYNVYNHSTPTLTVATGNNQSAIVGSTLADATLILSDATGTLPAPLDVNSLVNLNGASGLGVVASGATSTYTSAPLDTATAGIGKTLAVSLNTGDEQSITGANALSPLSENVTYNVYNHSTPTLSIGTGNNQSVFVNGSVTGATVILADTGTVPAPLDVNTLANLTGTTGSAVVASGSSGSYTATGFNTGTVGLNQTLAVSLKAGDQQTIVGANPLGTLNQTITYNVYNHATSSLTSGTLNLGDVHVGYANPVASTNSLTTINGGVNDLRVNLQGSAPAAGSVSLNSLSGIASGGSGTISATLATGQGVGVIDAPLTYTFADQSTIAGASSNVGTAAITVNGEVYSGNGVWAGNGTSTGSWGTLVSGFGVNWGVNQGSPGLDSNFTSTDTAAFGNINGQASQLVTLAGASPSLNNITFDASSTAYNIAQGTGGTMTLNGGAGSASIMDNATGGTQTISAPITLATNTNVNVASSRKLTISGNITGSGGLTAMGPGTTILSGIDSYTSATTINSGTLTISGSTLATGAVMVANGGTLSGTGSTGNVNVAGGGNINMQDGVIGTLTTNSLTIGNASIPSTISFDIASGSSNNLDHIADNGTLVLNGANGTTIDIAPVTDTPALTSGTYTLISSTGITGSLSDLSLSHTTLDGKSLALDIEGDSLDLVVSDLTTTTTYSLSASASASRIMVNTGTVTITSTIINSGTADTLTYTGLNATTTAGTLTGVAQNGGPLAINGGTASGTTILGNIGTTGVVTITPVVTSATNTTLGGGALLDSAAATSVDVVANRVVTATSVDFGRVMVGQAVSSTSTLSTAGDDADFTEVTVGTAGPDVNGISATGGNTEVFNGPSVTDTRTVGGTFTTAGSVAGNLTMITTGEGLTGEAPINVSLSYTADPLNKRVITDGATTDLGLFHSGATVNANSNAFTTSGTNDTTTAVSVAAGAGDADVNGVELTGGATTFDGSTSSNTATFGGTISSTTGGTVTGSFNLAVTTLENNGLGLTGEGTYNPVNVAYTAFVYTGLGVWSASGGGSWGTVTSPANWNADGGTPGLDSNFTSTDSATFGNTIGSGSATITLDGDSPSLNAITFANTAGGSYTLSQGTGGTLMLNGGAGSATITNASGNNTIAAPVELDTDATVSTAANTNLNLSGNISESGSPRALIINGPGSVQITGANSYSGGTTISSGTVAVGSATAFGAGSVTMNGGTLETGNGMHQINVAQNYTQTGGTLVLNLSGTTPGTSGGYEFLNVAGTANLGGALQVIVQPVYVPVNGDTFTFVQAGAITGGFSSETSNLRALSITPQGVGTILITQLPFTTLASVQNNPNQNNIATYIDNLYLASIGTPPFETLVGALDATTSQNMPAAALSDALDQLSTEKFHNFVRETVFNNASFTTQTLDNYLESRRSSSGDFLASDGTIDSSNLTLNDPNIDPSLAQIDSRLLAWNPAPLPHGMLSDEDQTILPENGPTAPTSSNADRNLNLFVTGNVTLAQGFSQNDLSHFNSTTGGVQLGADYRLAPHLEVGTFFNYEHADGTLDTLGSKATIDTYAPGIFLTYANRGWYANAMVSYGFNSFTEDRCISFGGLSGTSRANPNGNQIVGDLDGGYDFHLNQWTFGPAVGLQYANETVNGFTENGYAPTDLRVSNADTSSLRSRLGARATRMFQIKKTTLTPHIDAYWQHEFLDEGQDVDAQLASVGQGSFTVTTPRSSRDSALVDAGLNADLNGQISVYLDYLIQTGQNNYFGQSVQAGVKVGF